MTELYFWVNYAFNINGLIVNDVRFRSVIYYILEVKSVLNDNSHLRGKGIFIKAENMFKWQMTDFDNVFNSECHDTALFKSLGQ